jgi:outer membrane protein TolC
MIFIVFTVSGFSEARADDLTVEDCLRHALASSPMVLMSIADIDAASGQEAQAAASLQPNLRLGIVSRHWDQKRPGVQGAAPGSAQFFDDNLSETQLQLRQLLWDSGRSRSALKAARFETAARRLQNERIEEETIFAVLSSCIEVFNQQATSEAVARNVQDVTAALERMRKMKEVGRVAQVDVLRVEVREHEILAQQETVRHGLTTTLARLARICGLSEAPAKVLPNGIDSFTNTTDLDESELIEVAIQDRPDVKAGRARVEGAASARKSAELSAQPSLNLLAAGNSYGNDTGKSINNGFVGLELSWQLSDGGLTSGRRRQFAAAETRAQQLLHDAQLRVAEQVRVSLSAMRSASARFARSCRGLELAEEAYRIQTLNYEHGKGTVNDLLDAQSALFNARAQLIRDENDLLAARIALSLATGRLQKQSSASVQAIEGRANAEP